MEIRHLQYFVTVVEERSILQAAKKLNISQPPLSVAMKQLENELEVTLFYRGSRTIELTDAGTLFYQRSKDLLSHLESTKREIQSYAQGISGTLRLGAVSSSAASLLHHRLLDFATLYPNIRYEIKEGNTFEQLEHLNSGLIDLAIVRTPFYDASIQQLALDEDKLVAIMKKEFDTFEETELNLIQLKGKPLIYYRRFENLLKEECEKAGFTLNAYCVNDDARTSLQWAKAGLGIAIVPHSTIELIDHKEMIVKPINNERLITKTCLIYPKERELTLSAKKFITFIQKEQ